MLGVVAEIAERGEQIDDDRKAPRPERERPHVAPDQRGRAERARATQHRRREIEAHHLRAGALELGCVPPGAAREVQHPLPRSPRRHPLDQRHRALRVLGVAVRVEGMVLLAEPLLEPIGHSPKMSA